MIIKTVTWKSRSLKDDCVWSRSGNRKSSDRWKCFSVCLVALSRKLRDLIRAHWGEWFKKVTLRERREDLTQLDHSLIVEIHSKGSLSGKGDLIQADHSLVLEKYSNKSLSGKGDLIPVGHSFVQELYSDESLRKSHSSESISEWGDLSFGSHHSGHSASQGLHSSRMWGLSTLLKKQ